MKQMNNISKILSVGQTEEIVFFISAEILDKFAHLTGDHSSLHTRPDYNRRSIYRETVVHGMLPIMFISALTIFRINHMSTILREINTKFLKPVFINDQLCLRIEILSIDDLSKIIKTRFEIQKQPANIQVTVGLLTISFEEYSIIDDSLPINKKMSIISKKLSQDKNIEISDVNVNDEDGFNFNIYQSQIIELNKIIMLGFNSEIEKKLHNNFVNYITVHLLTLSVLSTFVGMYRPGRSATFLDFSINFERTILLNKEYTLKSVVKFVSISTHSIVENFTIQNNNITFANGKIKSRFNEPLRKMPSIIALRETGLDLELKNKVVLITGSSRGIGETTAKLFSLYGSNVAINYFIGKNDAISVMNEILNNGGIAKVYQADVANREQVINMVNSIQKEFGHINILVNNAVRNAIPINFLDLSWADIQKDIDVTLQGAFNCCQAVIPGMILSGGGKIININTLFSETPPSGHFKYAVSKSCLTGLTRSLAVEMAEYNIQVNMVSPSMVETDLSAGLPSFLSTSTPHETPMKRLCSPLDVARAVIFLASSQSSYTTGQKIMVTGGLPPFL